MKSILYSFKISSPLGAVSFAAYLVNPGNEQELYHIFSGEVFQIFKTVVIKDEDGVWRDSYEGPTELSESIGKEIIRIQSESTNPAVALSMI